MAANSKNTPAISFLGKRVINQIWSRSANSSRSLSTSSPLRRAANTSVYDKNPDDHELVQPSVVPDEVIQQQSQSNIYWAPHPQTGVFGPATEHLSPSPGSSSRNGASSSGSQGQDSTVLEEKAWFRPTSLEDLEKPHHHN